jgi:membrane-associated protein
VTLATPALLDAQHLVSTYGLVGIVLIVFAETGLLLGFFLPGDALLFLAGFAAAGNLGGLSQPVGLVCVAITVAAILGAQTGHLIGWKAGPLLFDRPESRLFKRANVEKAERVFERFGPAKAIVMARFVPIVRTFMNPLAGVLEMSPREFFVWNLAGGVLWGTGITLLGYFLGNVDVVRTHLELFVLGVVALSLTPIAVELIRKKRHSS